MGGGSAAVQGFKAYVAVFRSRETTWLVLSDGAERQEISHRRPLNDLRPITEDDVFRNVARDLSRQPEKGSALALLDRARVVRRAVSARCRTPSGGASGGRRRASRRRTCDSAPRPRRTKPPWSGLRRMPYRRWTDRGALGRRYPKKRRGQGRGSPPTLRKRSAPMPVASRATGRRSIG